MQKKRIVITGAGLAGSLLGIYLAKRGFAVDIYERRPDMRLVEMSAGRSINLALSQRGIYALEQVGLAERILRDAIPMAGRMIHDTHGGLVFQRYGKDDSEVINSISRSGINRALMNAAEAAGVHIRFNQRCIGADFSSGEVLFQDEQDGRSYVVHAETLIACDGATSPVRMEMQKVGRFNLNQSCLEHGYKELSIPATAEGGFRIEKNALHIWPRGTYMLIALPNQDGSFTCTLFLPYSGNPGFDDLTSAAAVSRFFEAQFADAVPLITSLTDDFFANPTGSLLTIKCHPWSVGGRALLLGDSAHAVVPFYGQGMNCAFEDCVILADCIDRHGDDWPTVFGDYEQRRKRDADAIADLAMANFTEMRDSVADPLFLMKKKLDLLLEERFPGGFLSTYAMVTFHRTPYARAMRRGAVQDAVLLAICREAGSLDKLDLPQVFARVQAALQEDDDRDKRPV